MVDKCFIVDLVFFSSRNSPFNLLTGGQQRRSSFLAVLYLVMQLYKYAHHWTFRQMKCHPTSVHIRHLPADHFLHLLPNTPHLTPNNHTLNVDEGTFRIFTKLRGKKRQLHLAVQALVAARKARKKSHTTDIEAAESDSDLE